MIIRLAIQEDLPVLKKLVGYACEELQKNFKTPRMDQVMMFCIEHGINTKQAVVVAVQDLQIIGWCARVNLPGLPPDHAEGVGTWTFEPFRKEHVAHDMRKFADKYALEHGIKYLTGTVALDNEAGIESALKDGWEFIGFAGRKELTRGSERTEEGHQAKAVRHPEALLVLDGD